MACGLSFAESDAVTTYQTPWLPIALIILVGWVGAVFISLAIGAVAVTVVVAIAIRDPHLEFSPMVKGAIIAFWVAVTIAAIILVPHSLVSYF
jgi:hypothetical protein